MTNSIQLPSQDDIVDRIAVEIGRKVAHHIETMYPAAAKAVAWESAARSIQGVVRNAVKSAGQAAEAGRAEDWIKASRKQRREDRANAVTPKPAPAAAPVALEELAEDAPVPQERARSKYYLTFNGIPQDEADYSAPQVYEVEVDKTDISEPIVIGLMLDDFYNDFGVEVQSFYGCVFRPDGTPVHEPDDYDSQNPPCCGPRFYFNQVDSQEEIITTLISDIAFDLTGTVDTLANHDEIARRQSIRERFMASAIDALDTAFAIDIASVESLPRILAHTFTHIQFGAGAVEYTEWASQAALEADQKEREAVLARIPSIGFFFAESGAYPNEDDADFKPSVQAVVERVMEGLIQDIRLSTTQMDLLVEVCSAIVRDRQATQNWDVEPPSDDDED